MAMTNDQNLGSTIFTLGDRVKSKTDNYEGTIIAGALTLNGAIFSVARNIASAGDRKNYSANDLELVTRVVNQVLGG